MAAEKGAPLSRRENEVLDERTASARAWLESYAPERARLVVRRDALPAEVADLDRTQRAYLGGPGVGSADGRPVPAKRGRR